MSTMRYSEKELICRALRNARPRGRASAPLWGAVEETFGVGSTVAVELCRAYGFDPDETVVGGTCERCAEAEEASEDAG